MLAYTRADVHSLNTRARELRQAAGELGAGEMIETSRGAREFAAGDRLYFLRNERSLGVKNGSLGTVERIRDGVLQVRLDGEDERRVVVDPRFYSDLDHGYAATVHKTQGTTVDRTYVLATPHFDRHSTYVALSRHREAATLFYGQDDFRAGWREPSVEDKFKVALSRARPKELAHDFLERDPLSAPPSRPEQAIQRVIERHRATDLTATERLRERVNQIAERLAVEREQERTARQSLDQQHAPELQRDTLEREIAKERELGHDPGLEL